MKQFNLLKHITILIFISAFGQELNAQVKIGDNLTAINICSLLKLENNENASDGVVKSLNLSAL